MNQRLNRWLLSARISLRDVRGFSLIELMVALAVLGMVMFIAIPSVMTWVQSSQIRAAAESMMGGLQSARAEAVRRNTSVDFLMASLAGGGVGSDWTVRCTVGSATCPGVGQVVTEIEKRSAADTAPHAVVSVTPVATTTIVFSGVGRITPLPAANIVIDVAHDSNTCLAAGGTARCMRLIVAPGGQVRMCDPSLPNTNPRGC